MSELNKWLALTLLWVAVSAETTVAPCEDGWVSYNGACYFVADNKKAGQFDAQGDCETRKADLVIFEIPEELQWLVGELSYTKSDGWWTRLYRNLDTNFFQWAEGYPPDPSVTNWNTEPDNANGKENCGALNEQGSFSDEDCSKKLGYICEIKSDSAAEGGGNAPAGWQIGDGAYFYVSSTFNVTQLMTWQQASSKCASMATGSALADLSSDDSMDFLLSYLGEVAQTTLSWWTSLNRKGKQWYWGTTPAQYIDDTVGKFEKEDNLNNTRFHPYFKVLYDLDLWIVLRQKFISSHPQRTNDIWTWVQEPNNLGGEENCVMLYGNGKLADKDCDTLANYVCKKTTNNVPIGSGGRLGCGAWVRGGNKCYYIENDFQDTYDVATAKCKDKGGELLKIESGDEKNYLDYIIRNNKANYWTQLRAESNTGQWTFNDGSQPADGVVVWNTEPNDFSGIQDCVRIFPKQTWDDASCRMRAGYICEAISNGQGCPGNWTAYGGSCYFFGPKSQYGGYLNWWMARHVCRSMAEPLPGRLLSVDDPDELAFVNAQLSAIQPPGSYWTGLNDVAAEGTLVYDSVDVLPRLDIIPWDIAPSCTTCTPDCSIVVVGGYTVDVPCTTKSNYICQSYVTGGSLSHRGLLTSALVSVFVSVKFILESTAS